MHSNQSVEKQFPATPKTPDEANENAGLSVSVVIKTILRRIDGNTYVPTAEWG